MKSLIQPSAYFSMMNDESGQIVLDNGKGSRELFSKEAAHSARRDAFKNNLIKREEQDIIEQQIDDSPLPARLSEAKEQLLTLRGLLDELRQINDEETGNAPPDSFSSKDGATPTNPDPANPTRGIIIH